jgi:hypothetical protein
MKFGRRTNENIVNKIVVWKDCSLLSVLIIVNVWHLSGVLFALPYLLKFHCYAVEVILMFVVQMERVFKGEK